MWRSQLLRRQAQRAIARREGVAGVIAEQDQARVGAARAGRSSCPASSARDAGRPRAVISHAATIVARRAAAASRQQPRRERRAAAVYGLTLLDAAPANGAARAQRGKHARMPWQRRCTARDARHGCWRSTTQPSPPRIPTSACPPHLPRRPGDGRLIVVGAGKAAAAMAAAAEAALPRARRARPRQRLHDRPARHAGGAAAPSARASSRSSRRAIPRPTRPASRRPSARWRWSASADERDLVLVLLSGGASALWAAPARRPRRSPPRRR